MVVPLLSIQVNIIHNKCKHLLWICLLNASFYLFYAEKNTYCVVANIVTPLTKSYSKRMKLILPAWIFNCIAANKCLPFEEKDFFYIVETVLTSKSIKNTPRTFPLARGVICFLQIIVVMTNKIENDVYYWWNQC